MEILFTPGRVTLLGESDSNRLRRIYLRNGKPGAWFVSGVLLATGKEVQGGLPTVEPDDDDDHDHKAEPKK